MKPDYLFSINELERYARHRSPVVRNWAFRFASFVYKEEAYPLVDIALRERDPLAITKSGCCLPPA